MKILKFEDLDIWKLSLKLTKQIYDLSSRKKFSSDFVLRDQIRRSIISVSSNIVEGFEKNNNNEFARFLRIAKGSVGEARNQIYVASVGYITQDEFNVINEHLLVLGYKIGGLIAYLVKLKKQRSRNS